MTHTKLTRAGIVAAAIDVADEEGLAALSMRRIADRLGTGTMSLYRHISGKDQLLAEMTDEIARRNPYPDPDGRDWTWRDRVRIAGEVDWELYQRHPWVLFAFATPRYSFGPHSLTALAWLVDGFRELGVTTRAATRMSLAVWCCISGLALPHASSSVLAHKAGDAEEDSGLRAVLDGVSTSPIPPTLADLVGSGDIDGLTDQAQLLRTTLETLCDGFAASASRVDPSRGRQ